MLSWRDSSLNQRSSFNEIVYTNRNLGSGFSWKNVTCLLFLNRLSLTLFRFGSIIFYIKCMCWSRDRQTSENFTESRQKDFGKFYRSLSVSTPAWSLRDTCNSVRLAMVKRCCCLKQILLPSLGVILWPCNSAVNTVFVWIHTVYVQCQVAFFRCSVIQCNVASHEPFKSCHMAHRQTRHRRKWQFYSSILLSSPINHTITDTAADREKTGMWLLPIFSGERSGSIR